MKAVPLTSALFSTFGFALFGGVPAHAQLSLQMSDPVNMGVVAQVMGGPTAFGADSARPLQVQSKNGSSLSIASLSGSGATQIIAFSLIVVPNGGYASTATPSGFGAVTFTISDTGALPVGTPVTLELTSSLQAESPDNYFTKLTVGAKSYQPGQNYLITDYTVGSVFAYNASLFSENPPTPNAAVFTQTLTVRLPQLGDPAPDVPEPGLLAFVGATLTVGALFAARRRPTRFCWRAFRR